jgi:hypothetical protein
MTERATENLIEGLSRDLAPVRPLRPPVVRALLWMAAVTLVVGAGLLRWANLDVFLSRNADPRLALECASILLTGITAVVAAFYLSLPDRSSLWRYAPLLPLAVWLATSSLGCLHYGVGWGPAGDRMGESLHCFRFIVVVSVPLALLLYWVLGRARPLQPMPVAFTAALGVAAFAAFILQFFHPFDSTLTDLATHLAAVIVVIGIGSAARRVLA